MAAPWRSVAVRGAATLAALALPAAVLLGAGGLVPWEPAGQPLLAVPVAAPPTDLVCPSPVRLATGDETSVGVAVDPQFDPTPVESVASLTALSAGSGTAPAAAEVRELGSTDPLVDLPGSGLVSVATLTPPATAAVLHADGGQNHPVSLAGSVVTRTDAGDLRGLVAGACRPASGETWLVGGSTSVQSSARLVVQNPGLTPATVALAAWGPTGPVDLAAAPELLVPAGTERSILLEGLAVDQPRIVVRVTSSGGTVTAYLQDSALNGLVPAGVSDVVAGQPPATRQVVPGVAVDGGDADLAVLRLLAPGQQDATVSVSVLGPDGSAPLPGAESLDLAAGDVLDVPLSGLAAGSYSLVVDADVPVVAGAMITRGLTVGTAGAQTADPVDRAWAASVPTAAGDALALPEGVDWSVTLAVPESADPATTVRLEVLGRDGAVLGDASRLLRPGRSLTVAGSELVSEGALAGGLVVRADGDLAWSVVLEVPGEDGALVAVLSPVALPTARASLDVRVE